MSLINSTDINHITELRICRGCLSTDRRLYDMRQNRLMEAYCTLLNTAAQLSDDLPHYMCSYCAALLLKYDTFRNKCIDTLLTLNNAHHNNLDITMIETPVYLVKSCTVIDEFTDENLDFIPVSTHITDYNGKIKVELDNLIDKTENIETASNFAQKFDLQNAKTSEFDFKVEVSNDSDSKVERDVEFLSDGDLMTLNMDSDNDIAEFNIKSERKTKLRVSKMNSKIDKTLKVNKKKKVKIKNKKPEFTNNLSELYNIDVVELSKEEQIKEIEDRKETDNYKLANFKCNVCYKGFIIEDTFNNHMLLHDDISGKYVCEICQYHFMSKMKLGFHKGNHKRKCTCKDCGFVTKYLHKVKEHHKWHAGTKYKCKHCDKEFKSTSYYYGHLKMNHPTSDQLVRCEMCGDAFYGLSGLNFHEKKTHKEMRSPECLCSSCGTQFFCSAALKAHRDVSGVCSPRTKYCVRCGGAFRTQLQLEEHEADQRKPRDVFKCDLCNKNFKSFQKYNSHMKYTNLHSSVNPRLATIHSSKNIICEICGKVAKNNGQLKVHHRLKHSNERPYQCTECPKNFQSAVNLQIHMRTHTGERPFQCLSCPKAFKTIQNLVRHNLVHSGERPHSCDVCGKTFKTTSDAKTHLKTVHMKCPMPPRVRRRNKRNEQ